MEQKNYTGYQLLHLTDEELSNFYSGNPLKVDLFNNEYLLLEDERGEIVDRYCYQNGKLRTLKHQVIQSNFGGKLLPRNPQQELAVDMLKGDSTTVKLVTGTWGSGKAQPDDTIIPTPNGYKRLDELKVGDFVFDRKGNPTKVLGIYPQGEKEVYKVTFSDGRTTLCNDEHLWSYVTSKGNLKTVTLREMIDTGLQKNDGSYRYRIPLCNPVEYEHKDFPVDPYVIGAFLGDGCCLEKTLNFSSQDIELVETITKLLFADTFFKYIDNNYTWFFKKDGQILKTAEVFKDLDGIMEYSYNKKIPEQYLFGDIQQRYALLQGLLDTDGSIDKEKGRISYTSTSLTLINQVASICHSLGMSTHFDEDRQDKYTKGVCYNLRISCPYYQKEKLFRLSRKRNIALSLKNDDKIYGKRITIRHVEKLNQTMPMRCIYVDNEEHLYLTNDYIVTHNTLLLVSAALEAIEKHKFEKIVWIRNNVQVKDTDNLGALPGTELDKMLPYVMPFADHCGGVEGVKRLIDDGILEVIPLGFLRGRSIRNAVIISSEAENLSKSHIQLLLGRVDEGSQLWLDADVRQRDRDIFVKSAGLETMIDKLKGNPLFGYVHLQKSERSATAQLADLLND